MEKSVISRLVDYYRNAETGATMPAPQAISSTQPRPGVASGNTEIFNRPPRIVTLPPIETVELPTPPARQDIPPPPSFLTILLPLLTITLIFSIYIFINHASMQQLAFLLPMAVFSVVGPLTSVISTQQKIRAVKRTNRENAKKYKKMLMKICQHIRMQTEEQRRVALLTDPNPNELATQIQERAHLWERRPEDPDFLSVRVGKGKQPLSVTLKVPEVNSLDPLAPELRKIQRAFAAVDDMPCSISLPKVKSLGITGRRQDVASLTHEIICQIAIHHSPEDVRILGIYPSSQKQDWEWMRDLPHTAPLKGCKLDRLTAVGEDEANELLNFMLEELSQRASKSAEQTTNANNTPSVAQASALPHLVVIVHDYVEVRQHAALTHAFKLGEQLGVSVIYMVAQQQAIPGQCRGVVELSDESMLSYAGIGVVRDTLEGVVADKIELIQAQRISQLLRSIHVASDDDDAADIPTNVRLLDLLDMPFADQFDPEKWWSDNPRFGMLRVPIGRNADNIIWLDLNDNVHGPHGIIAGTTGAGKSELLQSIIVGLAATHHPHLVNFVLVDFKGGAAFKPFEKIPHTVGMVTDLSGKLTDRALVALKSELRRREHILSQANAKKISEYIAMRAQNPNILEPLPHLFIIIDEFAELAKEHPMFMEGLVSVVQKGRSLGVHLILATQKPTGSVNANIWSNLKFRICLRVASLQDSRDMLGRSEAALLPSTIPGRAYFQIGSEIFDLFQSARISLPARVANEAVITAKQATNGNGEIIDQTVLMDAIEPYQDTIGAQLFKPWPAPLPHRIHLAEVYKRVRRTSLQNGQNAQTALSKHPTYGWLSCPVGMIDLPAEQRQEPWLLDMARHGGHVIIGGASGTGKSVFLRSLITSLALSHSPSQLHLYLIDFGGQALRVFEKLPHVGGVFGESDDEYIRRLLRKLEGIIEERKQLCTAHQIDDFLSYQRRRGEQNTSQMPQTPQMPEMPAIVLMIDRFIDFKQAHDKEMERLLAIARQGRTYGVYLVLTIDRPVGVPMQLLSLFEMRIALRLVEYTDSLILIGKNDASAIDSALAGRGYKRGKTLEEVHIALPVPGDDDDEQTRQLDEFVQSFSKSGRIAKSLLAPPIRLLPDFVRADYFLMDAISGVSSVEEVETTKENRTMPVAGRSLHIRLGLEDFSLRPISIDLNADTPHLLIAGGSGSGRTSIIQTCLMMLSTPLNKQARVIFVDFRRSSRALRRLPALRVYADTEERLVKAMESIKEELRRRLNVLREELEQANEDSRIVPGASLDPLVLVIDDYDQLSVLPKNPLNDMREFIAQARDLHFHIIVAGAPSDVMKSDAILPAIRSGRIGIILGADPNDPQVLNVRMSDMPPGRGYLVRRNQRYLTQFAYLAPDETVSWVSRLSQAAITSGIKPLDPTQEVSLSS
ncbi:MAG TPA: type VII secretion protein EssC [Ktedonobacter sp.]|nr:type VII secretion protein EssC [Ktedonobacter sp.]